MSSESSSSEHHSKLQDSSLGLSHIDSAGEAHMVDVGYKTPSFRMATAESTISLNRQAYESVVKNTASKGAVLTVAKIAGIQGAKRTSSLIPLCHQINLNKVDITFTFSDSQKESPSISNISLQHSNPCLESVTKEISSEGTPREPNPASLELHIKCTVSCNAVTGVEMEALVGASIAALTVYDMCKALDKSAVISNTRLLRKEGGKSGSFSVE